MESVESYVYSVLGAQAKTRWSIVSDQLGKSLQTQEAFRRIVGDTIQYFNDAGCASADRIMGLFRQVFNE